MLRNYEQKKIVREKSKPPAPGATGDSTLKNSTLKNSRLKVFSDVSLKHFLLMMVIKVAVVAV